MADDKSKRGPKDAMRVNVEEDYELRYWTERFGVPEDRLRDAVQKAGPMVRDVERELAQK